MHAPPCYLLQKKKGGDGSALSQQNDAPEAGSFNRW